MYEIVKDTAVLFLWDVVKRCKVLEYHKALNVIYLKI